MNPYILQMITVGVGVLFLFAAMAMGVYLVRANKKDKNANIALPGVGSKPKSAQLTTEEDTGSRFSFEDAAGEDAKEVEEVPITRRSLLTRREAKKAQTSTALPRALPRKGESASTTIFGDQAQDDVDDWGKA